MYQRIHEKIAVAGVYNAGTFTPAKIRWRRQVFKITDITLKLPSKDAGVQKYLYSVVAGDDVLRLEFNRETEVWWLLEKWVE